MISLDTVSPLTFEEFRNYYNNYNNFNELKDLYSTYLTEYKVNKDANTVTDNNYISDSYKELLKNIIFSFIVIIFYIWIKIITYQTILKENFLD